MTNTAARGGFRERRRSVDAGFVLTAMILSACFGFLSGVVAARIFTPEVRGEYALLTTVVTTVSVLANLGFAEAVVYFYRRGDNAYARTSTSILVISSSVSLLVAMLGLAFVPWLAARFFPLGGLEVAWLALGAGLVCLFYRNANVLLQAQGNFLRSSAFAMVQPTAFLAALSIIGLAGGTITTAATWLLFSFAMAAFPLVLPLLPHLRLRTQQPGYLRELFRFSLKSYANVAVNQLNYRVDIFILAYLLPDLASVADYHIASTLGGLLWILPDAYATAIYPRLAGMVSERERTQETVQAVRLVMGPVGLACVALALVLPVGVPLVFGERYSGAIHLTWILLPGILAMSMNKVLSRYFLSRNRHQFTAWATAIGVGIDVVLLLVLVPRWGVAGASAAGSAAYLATLTITGIAFLRMADLRPEDRRAFPAREIAAYRSVLRRGWARLRQGSFSTPG